MLVAAPSHLDLDIVARWGQLGCCCIKTHALKEQDPCAIVHAGGVGADWGGLPRHARVLPAARGGDQAADREARLQRRRN